MAEHTKYMLKVTAGPNYDPSTHHPVHVNDPTPLKISSEHIDASINVRIQDYRGLPKGSLSTSPYFTHATHIHDRYSIAFTFALKQTLNGNDVVFGNDFDHPIRDRLPPGFNTAFRIVKWMIDPGLDGDVYAEEPYLYGPLLSSINVLRVGNSIAGKTEKEGEGEGEDKGEGGGKKTQEALEAETAAAGEEVPDSGVVVLEEGAEGDGQAAREAAQVPADAAARKKHFLQEPKRKEFQFEEGRAYLCDFFNPYLDFNEFALKLPGFTLPIVRYWDGQPLRYVLKNRATNTPLFVIVFTLVPAEQVDEAEGGEEGQESKTKETSGASKESKGAVDGFVDEGVD
ncbi:hypothetical protein W97_01880 [Coniosporium apollinis CBS 100218]|uniref:Domain of unknown function at the cortex 1 domain-containing protein n=1 Tax=Coniosporium apollinis (strain CBS 100218) TaxID=1168221 RepID=R7YM13_CONA1|nr:uncharacterized protein W97_01880 [Coniosporium apollinis CBS 100218]EON62656.1 hypothetical protein W97_01880 [Coniosporium apollinis CBS 100218]